MNAQFQSIYDAVVTITNRPDLEAETKQAIKMATIKAHKYDEFPQDKLTVVVTPTINATTNSIEINTSEQAGGQGFIRFRKVLAVMNNPATLKYKQTKITDMFGAYGKVKTDVFYLAGSNIVVVPAVRPNSIQCIYLTFPDVREASYNSWIATRDEDIIVNGASSIIFDLIGKRDETARLYKLFDIGLRSLQADCVEVY